MIGPALARKHHLGPGSVLRLPGRDGMVDLRVGGVWGDPNGLGMGVSISAAKMAAIWGPMPPSELFVQARPGLSPESLAAKINRALRTLRTFKASSEVAALFQDKSELQPELA